MRQNLKNERIFTQQMRQSQSQSRYTRQDYEKLPSTKMELIAKVGDQGPYQKTLLFIFCCVSLINGMGFVGSSFFFVDTDFKCDRKGLLTDNCQSTVCSLPEKAWKEYVEIDDDELKTVATQFGPYYCDDAVYLDLAQTCIYFGGLVGYLFFSFVADNYGRRPTYIISWSITTAGCILFYFSVNLVMVAIGLFLYGLGAGVSMNMGFYFLGEVVEDNLRQKYSVFLQPWFATGACLVTICFQLIKQWNIITLFLMVIPSIIVLILIIFYVEETPQFLIRKGVPQTLKALNRIGKINKSRANILTEEDIINVINEQVEQKKYHKTLTLVDLIRFPSLRLPTLGLCYFFFGICILYYGPALSIGSIGFNIFASSYVVQFSQLIVYVPLFFYVDFIPRKKAAFILYSIAGLCSAFLLFYSKPKDCDFCAESIVQLFFVAIFRASSSLFYIILFVYVVQIFPSSACALGGGVTTAFGTLGSSISPILLGFFQRKEIDRNILFVIVAFLAVGVSTFMPETLGVPIREQIEEVAEEKKKLKQTGYLVIKDVSEYRSQYSGYRVTSRFTKNMDQDGENQELNRKD